MDVSTKRKKQRIAHFGGKLSEGNCSKVEKLPHDDFLYNIIKDMDSSKNVIPYQQSQEYRNQKMQEALLNEDDAYKKQPKKILGKRTFPLMKKCQTSINYIRKNICIPKQRAHVGFLPKPQNKSNIIGPKFDKGCSTKIDLNRCQKDSNSTTSHSPFKLLKSTNQKKCTNIDNVSHSNQTDCIFSSSDDDETAFESFVQKVNEKSSSSDSDSDSRIIIRRKRKKSTARQKDKIAKVKLSSICRKDKNVSKMTSIPLSDSSDSQSNESFEDAREKISTVAHKGFKRKRNPQIMSKIKDSTNHALERMHCVNESSEELLSGLDDMNHDSSDSESDVESGTSSKFPLQPIDRSDELILSTESTIQALKPNFSCYIRLKRDLALDKKAIEFRSTISIQPSNEASASSEIESNDSYLNSDNNVHEVLDISSPSDSYSQSFEDSDQDDCCIINEVLYPSFGTQPLKSEISNSSSPTSSPKPAISTNTTATDKESPKCTNKQSTISTNNKLNLDNSDNENAFICEKSTNVPDENTSKHETISYDCLNCDEILSTNVAGQESETPNCIPKIVSVQSLKEDPEIIDLSDDDSDRPSNSSGKLETEYNNLENEMIRGVEGSFKISKQNDNLNIPNNKSKLTECVSDPKTHEKFITIDVDYLKAILNNVKADDPEKSGESPACRNELSVPQTTAETITQVPTDSECIKEVITNTKCDIPKNNPIKVGECSTCPNIPPVLSKAATEIITQEQNVVDLKKWDSNNSAIDKVNNESIDIDKAKRQIKDPENKAMPKKVLDIAPVLSVKVDPSTNASKSTLSAVKKKPVIESAVDELDIIASKYIHDLNAPNKRVLSLLDLYKTEYAKYKEIKNTEINVSKGLKLLQENQVRKLAHLHASIKNLVQHDACFYKINQEVYSASTKVEVKNKTVVKKEIIEVPAGKISESSPKELKCEVPIPDKDAQSTPNSDSAGPSDDKSVRFVMSFKCVNCNKRATARCQGCAKVFYCSPFCAKSSWEGGHNAVCNM